LDARRITRRKASIEHVQSLDHKGESLMQSAIDQCAKDKCPMPRSIASTPHRQLLPRRSASA